MQSGTFRVRTGGISSPELGMSSGNGGVLCSGMGGISDTGIGEILFLGPGFGIGVKSGSGCSFPGLSPLYPPWPVWLPLTWSHCYGDGISRRSVLLTFL